jgi:hypothetical protein
LKIINEKQKVLDLTLDVVKSLLPEGQRARAKKNKTEGLGFSVGNLRGLVVISCISQHAQKLIKFEFSQVCKISSLFFIVWLLTVKLRNDEHSLALSCQTVGILFNVKCVKLHLTARCIRSWCYQ